MKKIYVILASLVTTIAIVGANANADIVDMAGEGVSSYGNSGWTPGAPTCDYKNLTTGYINPPNVDCLGWSWVYFKYIGGAENENKGMFFSPYHGHYNKSGKLVEYGVHTPGLDTLGAWINGECAKEGSGFWHKGRNYESEYDTETGPGSSAYVTNKHNLIHRDTYTESYLYNMWGGSDKSNLEKTGTPTYSNGAEIDPISFDGRPIKIDNLRTLNQTLTLNGVPMYEAQYYGRDEDVTAEYENATGHALNSGNWGFCSTGGSNPVTQTYVGEVKLSISGDLRDEEDFEISENDNKVHYSNTNKISVVGKGKVVAQDEDSDQQETSFTVSASPVGTSGSFNSNNAWESLPSKEFTLIPGIEYTICASNEYAQNYDSSQTPNFYNRTTISACTKVVYELPCSDFGTTITSDNHTNYGRISITAVGENKNITKWAGDPSASSGSFVSSETIWTTAGAGTTISYWGCMGGQVDNDYAGSGTTTYNVTGGLDRNALFGTTHNYVDKNSLANESIISNELGLSWEDNSAKKAASSTKDYQFRPNGSISSKATAAVGNKYTSKLSWNRKNDIDPTSATIEVKVPYNYVLNPTNSSTFNNLTIGEEYTLDATVNVEPRANKQLDMLEANKYKTSIKPNTIKRAWLFILDPDVNVEQIKNSITGDGVSEIPGSTDASGGGSYIYQGGASDSPIDRIKSKLSVSDDDIKISADFSSSESEKESYKVGEDEKIGSKICSLVSVWPADSHNSLQVTTENEFVTAIDDNNQSNALTSEAGENPYWRFRINCATVGKYPTMSVEGGSLVASGKVETSTTSYNHRIFGSWAEYDLVASEAKKAGSGASLAYATPQSTPNSAGDYTADGIKDTGELRVPQTLGNTASPDYGIGSDAENALQLSKKFAENIKGYCYDESGNASGNCSVLPDGATSIDNSYSGLVLYKANSNSSFTIPSNIYNNSENAVIVIYGKNIKISNAATQIDAMIIAEDGLDTCDEGDKDSKTGNQALLEKCNNDLIIKGAVYSRGKLSDTENHLLLDRSKGGGSFEGETLSPNSLSQRAEIFSFDPRIVKVSQDIHESLDVTEIQYIKEIAPRY